MQIETLKDLIPGDFSDNSRVWIYQSSRAFIEKEEKEIQEQLHQFYSQWHSHGDVVKGWAGLLFRQFIVMMADESEIGVSGCSTDSSVRIIKSIERQYSVNMFDRLMLTFLVKGKAEMLPLNQVQYAIDKGYMDGNTHMFNNVVGTKKELMEKWLVPVKETWLANQVNLEVPQKSN